MRFNQYDLQEFNISQDRFKEIVHDLGFKLNANEYDIQALYNDSMTRLRQDAEQSFKFKPKEGLNEEEIKLLGNKDENEKDAIFTNALIVSFIRELEQRAKDTHVKIAKAKEAYQGYRDFLQRKSVERLQHLRGEEARQEAMRLQNEYQQLLAEYKAAMDEKINNWKKEMEYLDNRIKELQAEKQKIYVEYGQKVAEQLDVIQGKDGQPLLKDLDNEQRQQLATGLLEDFGNIEHEIKLEERQLNHEIEECDQKIHDLDNQIKSKRSQTQLQSGSNGLQSRGEGTSFQSPKVMALSFHGQRDTAVLEQQRQLLIETKANKIEQKNDLQAKELALKEEAFKTRVEKIAPTDVAANIIENMPDDVVEQFENKTDAREALDQVGEVNEEIDKNFESRLELMATMQEELSMYEQMAEEMRESGISEGMDELDEMIQMLRSDIEDLKQIDTKIEQQKTTGISNR